MATKNQYQSMVIEYLIRRIKNKEKYQKSRKRINTKLAIWRAAIKRIDKRNKRIEQLHNQIKDFFGVSLIGNVRNNSMKTAKQVYYKYGIDNGINGRFLSNYIKAESINHTASYNRKRLVYNEHSKEMYKRFCQFIKDHQI